MTRLVLVHGRDLDGYDPDAIEAEWLGALGAGLAAAGSPYRPTDADASFVYYGDTLEHLVGGGPCAGPPVTVHAAGVSGTSLAALDVDELRFALAVAREVAAGGGHPDEASAGSPVEAGGPAPESLVLDALVEALVAALAVVDRHVPGLSGALVLTLARDVHAYLHDDAVRRVLDDGLAAALADAGPAVVVAHSLGSVVAYSVLAARAGGPDVPLLLTLGSPLGIRAVREAVEARTPIAVPAGVRRWVNVRDPGDLLALTDLHLSDPEGPDVENLRVDNAAPWNHSAAARREDGSWAGYLAVPAVAALVGEQATSQ